MRSATSVKKCKWTSPVCKSSEVALETALRRAEPENRVLTLEEVQSLAYVDYAQQHILSMECRSIIKQIENMFFPCVVAHEDLNRVGVLEIYDGAGMHLKEKSTYGVHWRCWLRKPTDEDMEATPWKN